jgi:cobalt-zinc-cadmium efflux system outer membrane protein
VDGVDVKDGISEDEAAALALSRSPTFLADLTRLRAAQADLEEASQPTNPRLSVLGPIGVIAAAVSLLAPVMSFLQLPWRTEAAARRVDSVAESLVQSGLNTVRDARLAHIELANVQRRLQQLRDLHDVAEKLGGLADVRASMGDISPADALVVRAQAGVAADAVEVAERDLVLAQAAWRIAIGWGDAVAPAIVSSRPLPSIAPPVMDLITVARQARPDVRAAELELEGAGARAGLERWQIVSLSAQADLQWTAGEMGLRVGGVLDLPVFSRNEGAIGRAEAALQGAVHRLEFVRQRAVAEVTTARVQLAQSIRSYARYRTEIVPPLTRALEAAREQYERGDVPYLIVLDALSRLGAAQLRQIELEAETRRAYAELERAVGARIEILPQPEEPIP